MRFRVRYEPLQSPFMGEDGSRRMRLWLARALAKELVRRIPTGWSPERLSMLWEDLYSALQLNSGLVDSSDDPIWVSGMTYYCSDSMGQDDAYQLNILLGKITAELSGVKV